MFSSLLSINTNMPYVFWGLIILGLVIFTAYAMVLDRRTNRHQQSKFRNRCKAEKTKYYD
jgi:hypothetical protein